MTLEIILFLLFLQAIVSELVIDIAGNFKEISQIYQLDVNIASLRFIHHPLFSREHVLAAKLMQLHDNYQQRQGKNISQLLIEKVSGIVIIINMSYLISLSTMTLKITQQYHQFL